MRPRMAARLIPLAWLLALGTCTRQASDSESRGTASGDSVSMETPTGVTEPGLSPADVDDTVSALSAFGVLVTDSVVGRTGPGNASFHVTRRTATPVAHLHRRMGLATFEITLRNTGLTQYPCTSCHTPGGARAAGGPAAAHQDIRPVHPAETGAQCANCHAQPDVDRLALPSVERATLDQPYRLCAQCHAPQVTAWAGGAHGKRLDGWAGRRVVMNCTDCHDPHRPSVPRRIPFPGPQMPAPRGSH